MRYFVNLLTKRKPAPHLWPMKRQQPKTVKPVFFDKNPEDYGWSLKKKEHIISKNNEEEDKK